MTELEAHGAALGRFAGGVTIAVAIAVECGWYFHNTFLKSLFPGIVAMNPLTAICFMLLGAGVVALSMRKGKWRPYAAAAAFVAAAVGITRLVSIFGGPDFGFDLILFKQDILTSAFANNRIAPNTALNFVLMGTALFSAARGWNSRIEQGFAAATATIAAFAIIGYAYSVKDLYGFLSFTPMALNTACLFLASSVGILALHPSDGFIEVLTSRYYGGTLTRIFVPLIIAIPSGIGFLMLSTITSGIFPVEYGIALFVIILILVLLGSVYVFAYSLNGMHEAEDRRDAQEEALLSSIGDGVIATDTRGSVLFVNKAAADMLHVGRGSLSGAMMDEVIGLKDPQGISVPASERPLTRVLKNHKPVSVSFGYSYVRPDRSEFPVSFTAAPVMLYGKALGAVEVFHDSTREREIDKAKSEFVSLASHQMRTPLSAIAWHVELLQKSATRKLDEKENGFIAQILASNQQMSDLVNALLNVSRIELGTLGSVPESVNVSAVTESIFSELEFRIKGKNIAVQKEYPSVLVYSADPTLFRVILQNLIGNAVKYTPADGRVSVALEYGDDALHIKVSDSGIGIAESQREKIFTKFFRTDAAKEHEPDGNGLGLYLVKSIIETHGGSIRFESKEGEGTTFFVELPPMGMKKITGTKTLLAQNF